MEKENKIIESLDNLEKNLESKFDEVNQVKDEVKNINDELIKMKSVIVLTDNDKKKNIDTVKTEWLKGFVKAVNEGTVGEGGYAIPEEVQSDIVTAGLKYGIVRNYGIKYYTSVNKSNKPSLADIGYKIIGENTSTSDITPTFSEVAFELVKILSPVKFSSEWMEDINIKTFNSVIDSMGKGLSKGEDWIAFSADGTSDVTDGGKTGILHNTNVESYSMATTNDSYSDVTFSDFSSLIDSIDEVDIENEYFFINKSFRTKLRTLEDENSSNRVIYDEINETLYGRKIIYTNVLPSYDTGTNAETPFAIFGDPQYLGLCEHINGKELINSYLPSTDNRLIFLRERVDVKPLSPKAFAVLKTGSTS